MKLLTLLLVAGLGLAQQAPKEPLPTAPVAFKIVLVEDGKSTEHELTAEAIETWNLFTHAQGLKGSLSKRWLDLVEANTGQLALREEFAPASIKADITAEKALAAAKLAKIQAAAKAKSK